jgi:hypothetical protein
MQKDFFPDQIEKTSPLIDRLRADLEIDRERALATFLDAVAQQGMPLVENMTAVRQTAEKVTASPVWLSSRTMQLPSSID